MMFGMTDMSVMGPPSSAAGFESCSLSGSAGAGYNLYGSSSKQSHQQKISGNHGGGGGRQKIRYGVYYSAYYDCNWDEDEPVDDGKNGELGGEVGRFTVKTRPKKKRCASPTAYSRKPSLLGDGGQSSAAGGGGRQSIGKKFFFKIARLITAKNMLCSSSSKQSQNGSAENSGRKCENVGKRPSNSPPVSAGFEPLPTITEETDYELNQTIHRCFTPGGFHPGSIESIQSDSACSNSAQEDYEDGEEDYDEADHMDQVFGRNARETGFLRTRSTPSHSHNKQSSHHNNHSQLLKASSFFMQQENTTPSCLFSKWQ